MAHIGTTYQTIIQDIRTYVQTTHAHIRPLLAVLLACCLTTAWAADETLYDYTVRVIHIDTQQPMKNAALVYQDENWQNDDKISLTTDEAALKTLIANNSSSIEVNGTTYAGIINKDANGKVSSTFQTITVRGKKYDGTITESNLAATFTPHHFVQLVVEGQTITVNYIGDRSEVTITYDVFYNDKLMLTQTTTGKVGDDYPRIDGTFFQEGVSTSTLSRLPYGITIDKYPTEKVSNSVRVSLNSTYTYNQQPFYPEGTRYSSIKEWHALALGAARKDRTQNPNPDRTSEEHIKDHEGQFYIVNNNGEITLSDKLVKTDTEFSLLDDMEPGYGWAFVGTPYRFRLMNKLAGYGMYLKWLPTEDGKDGYFTFDQTGSEFSLAYNYSIEPGDYGWAGPDENGVYAPYAYGCTMLLTDYTDYANKRGIALHLGGTNSAPTIKMEECNLFVYDSSEISATMDGKYRLRTSPMGKQSVDMVYTVEVEVPSGAKLTGAVTYEDEVYRSGKTISFSTPPSPKEFVAEEQKGYEGIVSVDNRERIIRITYLRTGQKSNDYMYVRNTRNWKGYFLEANKEGGFTCNPNEASLVAPIKGGRINGMSNGRLYKNARTFYLLEYDGGYWTIDGETVQMEKAERWVLIDENGEAVEEVEDGVPYAIVSETAMRQSTSQSMIWTVTPYSKTDCVMGEGKYSCEWELKKWVEPIELSVSIWQSNNAGVHTPLSSASIYWGNRTVSHNGKVYTIDAKATSLPGLRIPVLNPDSDTPSFYIYKLDVAGKELSVVYMNCININSMEKLTEQVKNGSYFTAYNRHGLGFLEFSTEQKNKKLQPCGAWNVEASGMAKDSYSQPIQFLSGYNAWTLETEGEGKDIRYYFYNVASGYYLAEDNDDVYYFSSSRIALRDVSSLFTKGYIEVEINPNNRTRLGIDLTSEDSPIRSMESGEKTQICLVAPPSTTCYYTLESNLSQGGVTLLSTGDAYLKGEVFFYPLRITSDNIESLLKPLEKDGYDYTIEVENDQDGKSSLTNQGTIRITYTPNLEKTENRFYLRGGKGEKSFYYFWSKGENIEPTDEPQNTQHFSFETAEDGQGKYMYYQTTTEEGTQTKMYLCTDKVATGSRVYMKAADEEGIRPSEALKIQVESNDTKVEAHLRPYGNEQLAIGWSALPSEGSTDTGHMTLVQKGSDNKDGALTLFITVPYEECEYRVIIQGDDHGQGEVRVGHVKLKDGDRLKVFIPLYGSDFNVKPLDGMQYQFNLTDSIITVTYKEYGRITSLSDLEQDGALYTLRSTDSKLGGKGFYLGKSTSTSQSEFTGDYDDEEQSYVDYTEKGLLWQILLYDGRYWSWNDLVGGYVGSSLSPEELEKALADGSWKIDKTGVTGTVPLYSVHASGLPHLVNGNTAQDYSRIRLVMPNTEENLATKETPIQLDKNGQGEAIFIETPEQTKEAYLQFSEDGGKTWKNMVQGKDERQLAEDEVLAEKKLGATFKLTRLSYIYTLTFEETEEHLLDRAKQLMSHRGEYLYPVDSEFDAVQTAINNVENGSATKDDLFAALTNFVRQNIELTWPEGKEKLLTTYNRKSNMTMHYVDGKEHPQLTSATDKRSAVWFFSNKTLNADGTYSLSLYNANGTKNELRVCTPMQTGHPEWIGSLLIIDEKTGNTLYDPETDNQEEHSIALAPEEEEVADNEAAYWRIEQYERPEGYRIYGIEFTGVTEDMKDQVRAIYTNTDSEGKQKSYSVYPDGFFILSDEEAVDSHFDAMPIGKYWPTITISKDENDNTRGTITVEYSVADTYFWEKLNEEVSMIESKSFNNTIGYPSQAAFDEMKAEVAKARSFLEQTTPISYTQYEEYHTRVISALNTYQTTSDIILPKDGDVVKIAGVFNAYTTEEPNQTIKKYLAKDDAQLKLNGDEAVNSNYWIMHSTGKAGHFTLESAYGSGFYLTERGLSSTEREWFIGRGTEQGRLSLYYVDGNASRYVEVAAEGADQWCFGQDNGHIHATAEKKNQYDQTTAIGESTDFVMEKSGCGLVYINVSGYSNATIVARLADYTGEHFLKNGDFIVLKQEWIEAIKNNPSMINNYLAAENVENMDMSMEFYSAEDYNEVNVTYTENLEALKTRMKASIENVRYNPLFAGSDFDAIKTEVEKCTTAEEIQDVVNNLFSKPNGKVFRLKNKATGNYLWTEGGQTLVAKDDSEGDNTYYTAVFVMEENLQMVYMLYNVRYGNYVSSILPTQICSVLESGGEYVMRSDTEGATVFASENSDSGVDNVLENKQDSKYVVGSTATEGNETDNQKWLIETATDLAITPIQGRYYYKSKPTSDEKDNPDYLYYATRSNGDFVFKNMGNGKEERMTPSQATANTGWTDWTIKSQEHVLLLEGFCNASLYTIAKGVGNYTDPNASTENSVTSLMSKARTVLKANSAADASDAYLALADAVSSLQLNMPGQGFYRLRNAGTGKYLSMHKASNDSSCPVETVDEDQKENNTDIIFWLDTKTETKDIPDADPDEDETTQSLVTTTTSQLLNYSNGQYLYACILVCHPLYHTDADRFEISAQGNVIGAYTFQSTKVDGILCSNDQYAASGSMDENTDAWYLEEVEKIPLTVSSAKWATLCLPVGVTIPDGVKAYKGESITNKTDDKNYVADLNLTQLTSEIPAGTPVLIEAEEGQYLLSKNDEVKDAPLTTTQLSATFYTQPKDDNNTYVLMNGTVNKEKKVGFYKDYIGNLNGFKAYLKYQNPQASSIKAFVFNIDGKADGVTQPTGLRSTLPLYTLDGKYMGTDESRLPAGIYIRGNKKIRIQ